RLAARDHAEAELVAHVGRPGLERERTANRLVTVAARAERFGERRVSVAVGGRAVERLVDKGERPGACPVALGCEREVRRSQAVVGRERRAARGGEDEVRRLREQRADERREQDAEGRRASGGRRRPVSYQPAESVHSY